MSLFNGSQLKNFDLDLINAQVRPSKPRDDRWSGWNDWIFRFMLSIVEAFIGFFGRINDDRKFLLGSIGRIQKLPR